MTKLYQQFRQSSLDLTPLGLQTGSEITDSVFTPIGGRILAWMTNSPAHFCQVEGMGSTVYAVNPEEEPGSHIHPVAADLSEFIGLLVRCKDAELILNAHRWSKVRFDALAEQVVPSTKAQSVLRALQNTYSPTPVTDAYRLMYSLQKDFNISSLPLHRGLLARQLNSGWSVGFGVGFGEACGKQQLGKPLPVRISFSWNEEIWQVPAVYVCAEGIVVDTILEVPVKKLQDFRDQWSQRSEETMTDADQLWRQLDDPLYLETQSTLLVNDKPFHCRQSYTLTWDPWLENSPEAQQVMKHYSLDRNNGYLFRRESFLRKGKQPAIRTIQLKLGVKPVMVPGRPFTAPEAGKSFTFTHPASGAEHTFTVLSETKEALNPNFLTNHPCCYTKLVYSLEPAISNDAFRVVDRDPGDPWEGDPDTLKEMMDPGKKAPGRIAYSCLRYEPAEQTGWRMIFRQKLRQDIQVKLLP